MDELEALDIARATLFLILRISAPVLLVAMGVGILISLFQALTQIQEATLTFVPKIVAMFFVLIWSLPYMGQWMGTFTEDVFTRVMTLR
ncbi:MAG: flagellar biosynthesis protein FliQ [Holosporales bacterium]|jgi:flagellar biosynthetic protein FliQ|nr:flagellar biosynthesis protein FliQ [Holosporales bacterium]